MSIPKSNGGTLKRRLLRDEIRERLIDDILKGRLQPGERIVETRIAQEFGVSQGPVREALRDLELLGFVVSSAFRGAQVRQVTHEELADLYPVRAALEAVAARAAATRLDEAGFARLDELVRAMTAAAGADQARAFIEADIAFHQAIVDASGNRMLQQFWETMRVALTTFVSVSLAHVSLRELAERHFPLVAALRGGDPQQAETAMREHIEEFREWLIHATPRRMSA